MQARTRGLLHLGESGGIGGDTLQAFCKDALLPAGQRNPCTPSSINSAAPQASEGMTESAGQRFQRRIGEGFID